MQINVLDWNCSSIWLAIVSDFLMIYVMFDGQIIKHFEIEMYV